MFSAPFSLIVDLGYNVVVNSNSLRAYRVEAHNLDWPLAQGRNYWLSVVGLGNGGFNQRACWPASVRCDMPQGGACNINIRQGAITGPGVGLPTTWAKVQQVNGSARDFAFLIAVRHIDSESSAAPGPGGDDDSNPCPADFDRSGVPTVTDIFAFLAAWFSGCP